MSKIRFDAREEWDGLPDFQLNNIYQDLGREKPAGCQGGG